MSDLIIEFYFEKERKPKWSFMVKDGWPTVPRVGERVIISGYKVIVTRVDWRVHIDAPNHPLVEITGIPHKEAHGTGDTSDTD